MTILDKINTLEKTGEERLSFNNQLTNYRLIDFWRWSVSDLISNATRGRLAEFIVATALNIDLTIIRDEWSPYDLTSPEPENIKIEVKSASFIQSWLQSKFSTISFSIKATRTLDSLTNNYTSIPKRQSDIYVFCLLKHQEQETINPLHLDQWEFYVTSVVTINNYKRSKTSITLKSLQKLTNPTPYNKLKQTIIDRHNEK